MPTQVPQQHHVDVYLPIFSTLAHRSLPPAVAPVEWISKRVNANDTWILITYTKPVSDICVDPPDQFDPLLQDRYCLIRCKRALRKQSARISTCSLSLLLSLTNNAGYSWRDSSIVAHLQIRPNEIESVICHLLSCVAGMAPVMKILTHGDNFYTNLGAKR